MFVKASIGVSYFIRIYRDTCTVACSAALCIRLRSILLNWFVSSVLSLLTDVLQPHRT